MSSTTPSWSHYATTTATTLHPAPASGPSTPLPPPLATPVDVTEPDIVAQVLGHFGRWQLRTILLILLCKIPSAWFMACIIYTAPTPEKGDYYCKPPAPAPPPSPPPMTINTSSDQIDWIRISPPINEERRTDRRFPVDACNIYQERLERPPASHYANYSNPFQRPPSNDDVHVDVIPCPQFEHNSNGYKSLVTQFDLVCSRQLLISVTQSFHSLGTLCGGLMAVHMLEHFSPRKLMLIGMLLQIGSGNLTGLVSTFQLHVFFRCLTAVFCALTYSAGQIILADITHGKAKTIVITLSELFWSIGLILLPGISIFFDSWSYLYVAISTSVTVLVFLHRWITDSPRWLLQRNKIDRTLRILLESAAFNNREVPLDLVRQLEAAAQRLQHRKPPTYCSIWDGKTRKVFIIAIHGAWLGVSASYNVMLLMIRQLGVAHIHVNTACMGFAEMMGVFWALFLILFTRRRWLWAGYLSIIAGLLTPLIWLVPSSVQENRRVGLQLIFWILLKLANSASLSVLTTCTGELVSAEKRPLLMLSVNTFARFWLVTAPFVSTLTAIHPLIPITLFALAAMLNGALMCFLSGTFWNQEQPRIEKVLTPSTYRRNSAILLLRRSSACSESNADNSAVNYGYDNPLKTSISELWNIDSRLCIVEEWSGGGSAKDNSEKETINF